MSHQQQLIEQVERHLQKFRSAKENLDNIPNKVTKCGINSSGLAKNSVKKSSIENCNTQSKKALKKNFASARVSSKFRTNKYETRNRSHSSSRQIVESNGDDRNVCKNRQNDSEQLNRLLNNTRCIYPRKPVINNVMLSQLNHKKWYEILQDSSMNNKSKNRVNAVDKDFPEKGIQHSHLENIIKKPDIDLKYCNMKVHDHEDMLVNKCSKAFKTLEDRPTGFPVQSHKTSVWKYPSSSSDHTASSDLYDIDRPSKITDKIIQCNLKSDTNLSKSYFNNNIDVSFAIFNPVRSLHFLIGELRGTLSKSTSENVHKIMTSMENILQSLNIDDNKFCDDDSNAHVKQNNPLESVTRKPSAMLHSNSPPVKLSSAYHYKNMEPVRDTESVSAQSIEILRKDEELRKVKGELLIHNLKKDIEKLKEEVNRKDVAVNDALTREKDLKKCLSQMKSEIETMKQKYEEQTESLTKMAPVCIQLTDENKVIPKLQESLSKANDEIKTLSEEKEDLVIQVKFYKKKKEYYEMIIAQKDVTWERLKKDIQCAVDMLLQHQQYLLHKPGCDSAVRQVDSLVQYVRSLSDMDKVNNSSYMKYIKPHPSSGKLGKCKSMHTSSPVSSISSTPDGSHSWDISRISDNNYSENGAESEVVILDNNADAFDETLIEKSDNFNTSDFFSLQNETIISADTKNIAHDKSSDTQISTYENQDRLLKCNKKLGKIQKSTNIDNALDILKYKPLESDTQSKLNFKHIQGETIETMKKDLNDMMNGIENIGKQGLNMFRNNLEIPDNIQIIMPPAGMSDLSTENSEIDEI